MTTITQSITALPTPPSTSSPATFAALADAFIVAMAALAVELETFRGQVNTVTGEVNTNAGTATTQAAEAAASALLADADATATAADRVQTGLDRIATAADRVQTALDAVATAADRVAVAAALESASVPDAATQAEAEAGTEAALRAFSPLRIAQAIAGLRPAASQAEMVAGTEAALRSVSPLRVAQAIQSISAVGDHAVKVTTGNGYGSTNTRIRRYTTTLINVGTHIVYADSAANGASFTIAAGGGGLYEISVKDYYSSGTTHYGASLNSAELTTHIESITAANRLVSAEVSGTGGPATITVRLVAGDVVRPHHGANLPDTLAADRSNFTIRKVGL